MQLYRQPGEEPDPLCDDCRGELYNQPVVGMSILSGLTQRGEAWAGGTILDPGNGKTYRASIEEAEGGDLLKVRGYIGISLIGRTQTWHRVPAPDLSVRSYLLDADGNAMPYAWSDGTVASPSAIAAHLGDDGR